MTPAGIEAGVESLADLAARFRLAAAAGAWRDAHRLLACLSGRAAELTALLVVEARP